ncbi:MAG: SDR family oxidoreductase [Verrucomicrobiae bacterium]|nr:SDR family oxidoreductase [Verrucomicrobiae bacterium]
MKRLLVTGASGLVGSHLLRQAAGWFESVGTWHSFRPEGLPGRIELLDITDPIAVGAFLDGFQPQYIIHCAAMSDSVRAEREPDIARQLNVTATAALVRHAERIRARLVFLSSDVIFDGRKNAPYVEDDPPSPLGVYAATKRDAELAVRDGCDDWLIARTSLIYGPSPRGDRSVNERLGAAIGEGRRITLFVDEFRCPISVVDLAAALLELVDSPHRGVFHLAGPERINRYDLGLAFARHFGWPTTTMEACKISDVPMSPPRPADVTLDCRKALAVLKAKPRGVAEGLRGLPAR